MADPERAVAEAPAEAPEKLKKAPKKSKNPLDDPQN